MSMAPMPSYTISVLRHDDSSELFTFEKSSVIVGRETGDVVTGDPQMSNRHAELTFAGGLLTATDLNSTNGTYLRSGERLTAPHSLTPGTALRLGGCTLIVQDIVTGFERGATQIMTDVPAPIAPGREAASDDLFDQFKYYLAIGLSIYKQHYLNGIMTTGLVMVPAALLSALFGLIPVIGIFLSLLVGLGQLVLAPISTGAMGRWALAAASGRSLTWKQAWRAALQNPVQEWLNMAVMAFVTIVGFFVLIIPGIVLGMFSVPSYLLEDKRLINSNLRSAELVMKDPGHLIGLAALMVLTSFPVMLAAAIVGYIVGLVPMIGAPLSQVFTMAATMVVVPFIYLLWSLVYFDTRKRLERVDARLEHQAKINEWG